jgi:para-nitrobenzyl esterase
MSQIQTGENVAVNNTNSGKVRGYIHSSIFTYKGILYAESKRFEAPQKPKAGRVSAVP